MDTASLATWFLFGKLICIATLFDFGEKRCRKNLPLSGRGLPIRETIRTISNAAKQVCAAICLQRFCAQHSIAHPKLDSLIEHLWAFASIGSPDEFVKWDSGLNSLALAGFRAKLDGDVSAAVDSELLSDFSSLVSNVENLGMCDAYGADTDGPIDMLLSVFSLLEKHDVPIPSLDAFTASEHNVGWGMPVDPDLLDSWRSLRHS
ncbi:hypothetical protein [Rhodopirellula sp. SWK7]|uniref:hypothetical protein n=1 Tax=Rhodopirellula sp. SWK7 TaxID=595460 RepID=UPI0011819C3B|nr:hypothetical protein [Rhodopirellula sp. SWK7]